MRKAKKDGIKVQIFSFLLIQKKRKEKENTSSFLNIFFEKIEREFISSERFHTWIIQAS